MTPRLPLLSANLPKFQPYYVGGVISGAPPPGVLVTVDWYAFRRLSSSVYYRIGYVGPPMRNDGSDLNARGPAQLGQAEAAARQLRTLTYAAECGWSPPHDR